MDGVRRRWWSGAVNNNRRMSSRLLAFVIWGAVAATAVYWGLRLGVTAPAAPAFTQPVAVAASGRGDLSRVLGEATVVDAADDEGDVSGDPALASRFQLLGVVAPKTASRTEGLALIAVDGGLPRAYRVGAVVDGQTVLQSVHRRGAELGPRGGDAEVTLELPPLPPPATGTLGAAGAAPAGGPAGAVPPRAVLPSPLMRPPPGIPVPAPPVAPPAEGGQPED